MAKKKKTNNGYEGSNFQKWASSNTQSSKSTESTAVTTTPQKNSYQGSNFQKWATKTDEATQEKKQTEQIKSNSRSVINSISQWSKNVRNAKNANTRDQLSQQGQQYMNILKSNKDSISADVLNQATNVLATGQRYLTEQAKKSSWASDYNKAVANTDTDTHKIKFGSSSEGSTSSNLNNGTYKEDTDSTYKGLAKAIEQGKSATAETNAQDKLYQAALKATQQQEAVGKGLQTDAAKAEQLQGQQNRKLQQIQSRADYEANSQKDDSVKDEQYQWINAGKKLYTDDNDYLSTLTMVANLVPETSLIPGTTLKAKDMVNEARLGSLMTDEELKNYNYLYKTEGSDSATNYLDSIRSDLQSRYRQDTESRMAQYSEEAPVAAWLTERVLNTYVEPLSYVSNLETKLKGEDLDSNGFSQSVIYGGNAITNQQVDSINSDFGKFLYQTGSSMADFAASLLATGGASALTSGVKGAASGVKAGASALKAGQGIKAAASAAKTAGSAATVANAAKSTASAAKAAQNASLAIMGTTAAAETIQDAKDRGLTDAQALTLGTISGLAEVATEKVSIDTLLDKVPSLGKNLPGYIAKNVLAEGSEEGASDVINLFADILVSKDKSEWQTSINEYVNAGYTEEEAFGLAVKDQAAQVLQDMAGGALSGGIFAGATGGLNAMANHTMNMQTAAEEGTAEAAIESGLESPKDSRSYKLAEKLQKKIENGETVTQKQVAALLSANEKQINYEDAVAAQEDEAERKAQGYSVEQWENKKKIEKALSQTTEQMQTAQAEAQQASGLNNEQWAMRNRITNGQNAVNPVYNNFTTSSRTRALDAIGAPSMNSNYKMSNSRGYISSENKATAQAASDNYAVGRIAQNFSTSGMMQTAKAVENGYKADMNPTVYMQAVQAAFETGYSKKPISRTQGIDFYLNYVPMSTMENIYNAALSDRINRDKASRTNGKQNGRTKNENQSGRVQRTGNGLPDSSAESNTTESEGTNERVRRGLSRVSERGIQSERGGLRDGDTFSINNEENNNEREIRISEERGRETVQDTGRQSGSVAGETGRTESVRESDRHGGTEQKVSGNVQTAEEKSGRVTAKSLGIEGGTDEVSARIVNVSDYDESTKALSDELKDFGLEVVAFEGSLSIEGVGNIRGAVSGNKIYVKTNASNYDAYQIGKHEFFHSYITEAAKSKGRSRESIVYGYWNKVVELYDDEADFENYALETYRALYDGTGYSDAQLIEEMLCDMFAGMNELSNTAVDVFSLNTQERFYKAAERLMDVAGNALADEVYGSEYYARSRQQKNWNGKTRFSKDEYHLSTDLFNRKEDASNIDDIEYKYRDKLQYFIVTERANDITLNNIVVKPEYRNQGIGQSLLDELIVYADLKSKTLRLTPTKEYGTQSRLIKWYKHNGFVENKGKNTDLSSYETMYRLPQNIDIIAYDGNGSIISSDGKSDIRFSIETTEKYFKQQLNDWMKGHGKAFGTYNGKYFELGWASNILRKHGAQKSKVYMFDSVITKITGGKHTIALEEISKLPSQLSDPILLFEGNGENTLVALTEIKDKEENDVIVSLKINTNYGRAKATVITSAYAKSDDFGNNNIRQYVMRQINDGKLRDVSINKTSNWFTTVGLQLPSVVQTMLDAKQTIAHDDKNNKEEFSGRKDYFSMETVDSEGNRLSKKQAEYFEKSKIRDEDGNLKVMYHGTDNGGFTIFDRGKAKSSGHFGTGFYFAPTKTYSSAYTDNSSNSKIYEAYLNITNPIDAVNASKTLSKIQVKKLVKAIAQNEEYGIENYGYDATVDSVTNDLLKHNSDFEIFQDLDATCVGDFVELVELANKVIGTSFDGIRTPLETIAFNPNQIKLTENANPTDNVDIRFSKELTDEEFHRAFKKWNETSISDFAEILKNDRVYKSVKTRKKNSEARQKLLNVTRRLERMKTTSANRALIASAIGDLDTVSVGITGKTIEKLEGIKEYYDHKMDPNHAEYDPDFIASNGVLKAIDRLSKKRISEMDLEDVKDLTIILRNLEANIRNEKKLIDSEDKRETWQMGQEIVEDIQSSKGVKAGIRTKLDDVFVKGSLTADRAIRRMTGYIENDPLYKATKALDRGQWNMYKFQMESTKPFEKFINDKKFTKKIAGKNAETVKIKGTGKGNVPVEVEITRDQLMSLYMHSFNNDNLRHIKEGGLRVPDIKLFKKGDIKEAFARGTLIRLTPSQVRHYASQLTAQEKAFCEAARDYFSGTSQNAINEVSEKLMGYSLATVDNYFPINTASDFTKSDFESIVYNASIEGMGFLKERMEGAANAINLLDMSKVLQTSIEGTSKYVGYAIPVRNFKKLLHVSTGFFDDENRWHADDNIMTAIGEKWGNRGRTYIETLLSDIEGGTVRENQDNVFNRGLRKLQSNYAGAVINMNLSVAIKQASGYPAAISTLGHKAVLKGLNVTKKVDDKLIEKYSPLLWTRMQGYSTPELGMIHDEGGVFDKLLTNNKWLNWISAADIATVRTMWRASEYYVKDNNKNVIPGTDPYYKAVAEIFEKAVEETQPNYTTMQRPELLRTNNALVSSIMMFKSQSFQNFNVLYDAFNNLSAKRAQFKAGVCTADELKMAKKQLSWAISGQFWQALIFTTLGIVWNFLRGREDKYKDEEGNLSPELMLSELGKEMISNTAGIIPFGEEAWDVISSAVFGDTYYGMDPAAISMINDIVDTGLNIVKDVQALADADEDFDWHNERLKLSEYLGDISKAFGVPYENIEKAVKIGLLWGMRTFGGDEGDWEYTTLFTRTDKSSGTTALFDKLFEAYESDEELYNQMREDLVKLGYTEEQIDKKMLKYITGGETKAAYDDMYGKIAEGKADEAQELYDKLISVGVSEDSITSGLKKAFVRDIANDPEIESSDYAYEYLYSLYKSDYKSFKETYELMIDVGFTAKGIKSGVETLMKAEQGVDNVSKLKSRFKAPTTKSEQALKTSSTASTSSSSRSASSSSTNESISTPESSYIASASYNGGKLTVKFQSGKTYTYNNVPEDVWEGFKDADSKGTYYSKKIKGKY